MAQKLFFLPVCRPPLHYLFCPQRKHEHIHLQDIAYNVESSFSILATTLLIEA